MMSQTFKQFFLFALQLGSFALNLMLLVVHAQDQSGFISIDCGIPENSSYTNAKTGINYISDATFIDSGEGKFVLPDHRNNYSQPYWSLRSFPEGIRNCYKINVTSGIKYLIRACFFYGNYDGHNKLPEFELHIGANWWETLRFRNASDKNIELIHVPLRNYIHVCLVNKGSGVPFISAIELRPLNNSSYQTQLGSLQLVSRYDTGQATSLRGYRYPFDIHDRFWSRCYNDLDHWTQLSTSSTIDSEHHNEYQPPRIVMSTAATPKNPNDSLNIFWQPSDSKNAQYHIYMHFAEVEMLQTGQSRRLNITRNGELFSRSFALSYLYTTTISSTEAFSGQQYKFSILKAENSTLPPILNAFEVYKVKELLGSETNQEDVDAITNIKLTYKIKKNWQGDPCGPKAYLWEGLECTNDENEQPRVISLDLSRSGLTGEIARSISNLTMMRTLDLSNNYLTGPVPEFLSQLPNLNVLNLEKNKLSGSVPVGLIERKKDGLLSLSLCKNLNLSGPIPCKKKHNFIMPAVVSVIGIFIFVLTVAVIFRRGFKRTRQLGAKSTIQFGSLESTKRNFTYCEMLKITNNFERILGKGGFGTVYHGYIHDTQVAIKMLSESSVQGFQQFHAEVNLLMRVHHKNLTNLVGFCNDETNVGLVYEYMAKGNLREHLFSGSSSDLLTWEDRLRIATDTAQGLEYLHYGCKPPIMHRDVKSTNILLNENFQAKLSDFGLSRICPTDDGTTVSSLVAGTPGYLDPEYYLTLRLNEKSDVYSFGIVLLEIITSRHVLIGTDERIHISQWVGFMLANGDIYSIVDARLEGNFNVNSVWKAVEIAMACVSTNSITRPNMSEVVVQLKECLMTELDRTKQSDHETELRNSTEIMSDTFITMLGPSLR